MSEELLCTLSRILSKIRDDRRIFQYFTVAETSDVMHLLDATHHELGKIIEESYDNQDRQRLSGIR